MTSDRTAQSATEPAGGMSAATVQVQRFQGEGLAAGTDVLAVEEPLEIRVAFGPATSRERRAISLTMRTPGADRELAAGFLYTEGIVADPRHLVEVGASAAGPNVVRAELHPGVELDPGRLQRHFYTTSSCGVCGKTSLDALETVTGREALSDDFRVSPEVLLGLPDLLRAAQEVFGLTGGLHAAALFDAGGTLLKLREDVGRHNALDKLIGAQLLEDRLPLSEGILLLSGRASFELLQKAFVAGAPVVAAVGAPSSLAVRLAERFGITLIGWLRGGRFNVYSHAQRIVTE